MGASAMAGRNRAARSSSGSIQSAGSGSTSRCVAPTDVTPGVGTTPTSTCPSSIVSRWVRAAAAANPGSAARGPAITSRATHAAPSSLVSSTMWRGPRSISSSATTPQSGRIGRQAPVGSSRAGVQGPAVTITEPATSRSPPASSTPVTRSPSRSSRAPRPARTVTPRDSASVANPYVPDAGAMG